MMKNNTEMSIVPVQKYVALLTGREYSHGLSIYNDGTAHIIKTKKPIMVEKGFGDVFYFDGVPESQIDWSDVVDAGQSLDRQPLRILFTCIDQLFEKGIADGSIDFLSPNSQTEVSISIRDLLRQMGTDPDHVTPERMQNVLRTIMAYENVIGMIPKEDSVSYTYHRVLFWTSFDPQKKIIKFISPYLWELKRASYQRSLIFEKHGKRYVGSRTPSKTNLMKASLKDGYASEIIEVVLVLLERTSNLKKDQYPTILASTIIEQCPMLSATLKESTPNNRYVILDRAWRRAWSDIRIHTYVYDAFKNLQLPDPNSKTSRPTYKNLKKTKFVFKHDGKIKNWMYDMDKDVVVVEPSDLELTNANSE